MFLVTPEGSLWNKSIANALLVEVACGVNILSWCWHGKVLGKETYKRPISMVHYACNPSLFTGFGFEILKRISLPVPFEFTHKFTEFLTCLHDLPL